MSVIDEARDHRSMELNVAGVLWALVIGVFVLVAYQLLAPSSIFQLFRKMQQSRQQGVERILAMQRGLSSLTAAERQVLREYVQERKTHCSLDTRDEVIQGLLARDILRIEPDVEEAGGTMRIFTLRAWARIHLSVHPALLQVKDVVDELPS